MYGATPTPSTRKMKRSSSGVGTTVTRSSPYIRSSSYSSRMQDASFELIRIWTTPVSRQCANALLTRTRVMPKRSAIFC